MKLEALGAEKTWLRYAFRNADTASEVVRDMRFSQFEVWRDLICQLVDEVAISGVTPEMLWDVLPSEQRAAAEELGQNLDWLEDLYGRPATGDEWIVAQKQLGDRRARQVLERSIDLGHQMLSEGRDIQSIITMLSEATIAAQGVDSGAVLMGEKLAEATVEVVAEHYSSGGKWSTGIRPLDTLFDGGVSPGNLLVIGAPPSHGKSMTAHAIAEGVAYHNDTYAFFFDCEMGRTTTLLRQLERMHGTKPLAIPDAALAFERLAPTLSKVKDSRVMVGEPRDITLSMAVRQSIVAINNGCRVVIWDGATLLRVPGKHTIREEILEVTRTAKSFARRHNVVVILTGQLLLERLPQDGRLIRPPGRADFKESKSFVEDADYLLLVRRVDKWQCIGDKELYGVEDTAELKRRKGLTWFKLDKSRHTDTEGDVATLSLMTPGLRFTAETLPKTTTQELKGE